MIEKRQTAPKKGMNRDKAIFDLDQVEYSFMLNGNFHDEHGHGQVNLQNEPSNIYCTGFKSGSKVIGHKFDPVDDVTYFILVDPTTGVSEIGFINSFQDIQGLEPIEKECDCNITVIIENPLEQTTQTAICKYTTLLNDECEEGAGCLAFSIDYPIHESNIIIKHERTGKKLYFTDFLNPQRLIDLDHLDQYTETAEACTSETTQTCLQCESMRIFPLFEKPCLTPSTIQGGGNLRAGMYEVLIAYSSFRGEEVSNYYAKTNQIPIHDRNNNILDQTNLDYETNLAISIDILGLDKLYDFFKIAVVYRNGLDATTSIFDYGVFPIDTNTITISSLSGNPNIPLNDIIARRPSYTKAKGLAAGDGYLYQYGLEANRSINLQPIVNLLGGFVKWQTVQAKESIYKDGVEVANFRSYMRDEVVPAAIKFFGKGGVETDLFPFIPRPPKASEIEDFENGFSESSNNVQSILNGLGECSATGRDKRWQYENTASIIGTCPGAATGQSSGIVTEEELSCFVSESNGDISVLSTINTGTIVVNTSGLPIETYINNNVDSILTTTGSNWQEVRDILSDPSEFEEGCEPTFPNNCTDIELTSEEMIALGTAQSETEEVLIPVGDLSRPTPPASCRQEVSPQVIDQDFVDDFMLPLSVVYKKNNFFSNTSPVSAVFPIELGLPQADNTVFLQDGGSTTGIGQLQTQFTSLTSSPGYTNKVHTNGLWYKIPFSGQPFVSFEMSYIIPTAGDDNSGNSVRITVFDGESSTAHLPQYTKIVSDVTAANDPNKYITFDANDFSGNVYVVIDSPIKVRIVFTQQNFTLTPPPGCFNAYYRLLEYQEEVTFSDLTFGKRQTYKASCNIETISGTECDPTPHQYGLFSHWESNIKYPCNGELYDSSTLGIDENDIPNSMKQEFEEYYSQGVDSNGKYILGSDVDFRDKPIRHYKFPCSTIVPFMSGAQAAVGFKESYIFPIGFSLDPEAVRTFLDIAVNNNLISLEERNNITSYEVYRGDRTTHRSIIAKGLLFDMYEYTENNGQSTESVLYPNYPLNDIGVDNLNGNVPHRRGGVGNDKYTFHSPDVHLHQPTLPPEMKIEGYQSGVSQTFFDIVEDHPTYVILGQSALNVALALAIAEVVLDVAVEIAEIITLGGTGGLSAPISVAAAVVGAVAIGLTSALKTGKLRYEWLNTIKNLGSPQQFAYYSATVGHYNAFLPNSVSDSTLRGVSASTYLREGRWEVPNEISGDRHKINNESRETSVFLDTAPYDISYPQAHISKENGSLNASTGTRKVYDGTGKSGAIDGGAASPYVSLKQYLPSQYGAIHSVTWLSTGYCGDVNKISQGCEGIFGGDTYISRFSVKRKLPFFTTNAHGLAPLTPFKYSDYYNINPDGVFGRFFLNYELSDDDTFNLAGTIFPDNLSSFNLTTASSDNRPGDFYVKPPAKFFLFSYGFPHFLAESTINSNYRYAQREAAEDFYPNFGDVIKFTQESDVSIREPNRYYYNDVYSTSPTTNGSQILPVDYSREIWDRLNNLENSVIYSVQDRSEDLRDSWLIYKAFDTYQFPTSNGNLIDMDAIESGQILGRFENGITLFNSIDVLRDRLTGDQAKLGSGGIFSGRNINFNKTDLGYAGTQHTAKVSCEFGHFWADAKRGEVFKLEPNGKGLSQITDGVEKWFKEHLPFKITNSVSGLTQRDLDNSFKGLGLTMGWDSRTKRIFITKLDYKTIVSGVEFLEGRFYHEGREVLLTDRTVFEDCSFTVAYSPLTKLWISYYSFKPNYYIGYTNYFQTGINYSTKDSHLGLWSHLPFLSSYQVFYGDLYPFIIESPLSGSKLVNSTIHDIEYWMDVRKYYNKYDFTDIVGQGFNKAVIYNTYQNTGQLELVHHDNNDLSQSLVYPKHNSASISILQSEIAGKYSFNHLYNSVKNERSGLPIWLNDCTQVGKDLNHKLLTYAPMFKDRMVGDHFMLRLEQDKESRYKYIYRFGADKRDYKEN